MVVQCPNCAQKNRIDVTNLTREIRCGKCRNALTPLGRPIEADAATFDEVTGGSPLPVLVDFWAAWCGPCRMAAPHVERVAASTAGRALVLKVDTERYPEIAGRYGVESIPNFVVLKQGRVVHQHAGLVDAGVMTRWLEA